MILRSLRKDTILIHWNIGFHKNPEMIKLQTRLVDHLKLLEQKIKDTKVLPKVAQLVFFPKVNKLEV